MKVYWEFFIKGGVPTASRGRSIPVGEVRRGRVCQ